MNELTDQQLLRDYAEHQSEAAFAELVRRHVDLIYSAALRMVCDAHLAKDVTQNTFLALAQNAAQLADRPVLSGWLHRTAQNLAAKVVRTDVRRRAREQEAAAMNELLADSGTGVPPVWSEIAPHLDAALGELAEPDRDALLLRYFERKSAREMAQTLGTSEDAAQKRVSRAVERLRESFAKRGVTVGASGLVLVICTNAVQAAPVGLAVTISTAAAALTGMTLATTATATAATATKAIAMTTLQKTILGTTLVVAVGTGIYEARQASILRDQLQTRQQQPAPLADQIEQLVRERDDATRQLAALRDENQQLNRNTTELVKLRGEVARLRADSQELARLKALASQAGGDPAQIEAKSWLVRMDLLKQWLARMPDKAVPELQFATDQDWLNATKGKLETEKDYRRAVSSLRNAMEQKFANVLQSALSRFMDENNNQFPTDLSQLQAYFKAPVDEAILQRYAIFPKEEIPSLGMGGKWIISQKAPVDEEFDSRTGIGPNGWGSAGPDSWEADPAAAALDTLDPVLKAYSSANGGNEPTDLSELLPYIKTPEQRAAYDTMIRNANAARNSKEP